MAKTYNQIGYGSRGNDVKTLQEQLNKQGYKLSTDGIFGQKTLSALKDFQKKNNLTVDGIAGKNTWGKIWDGITSAVGNVVGYLSGDKEESGYTYTPFEYGDFAESEETKGAKDSLTNANNALTDLGDFSWVDQGKLDDYTHQYESRPDFSYDFNSDALYQQYKDKYIKQAKMASADVMGQAAAMTGGYGSSYAQTVGNQAYQANLEQLNDVIPELYQLAYDKYNQEGQDLLNMISLLRGERDFAYGQYNDEYSRLASDRDYWSNMYNNLYNRDYGQYSDNRTLAQTEHSNEEGYKYGAYRDAIEDQQWQTTFDEGKRQWQANFDESLRQFNEQMAFQKQQYEDSKASGGGGSGGSSGSGSGGSGGSSGKATFADTLWNATGTYDDSGNPVFRNSEGKTQAFGQGINPYTGTKHADAKHGTFSNGYQPNNIGGTKLKNSGMSTNITGKNQTIWEANGKYWLWRGDLNKYIEVDVSDLD